MKARVHLAHYIIFTTSSTHPAIWMQYEGGSNFTPVLELSRQVFKTNLSHENKDSSVPPGGKKKKEEKIWGLSEKD